MKTPFATVALLGFLASQSLMAQQQATRITIPPNGQSQVVKGRIQLQTEMKYAFPARAGWFLTVKVSATKPTVRYKIEAPGRRGVRTELFSSSMPDQQFRGRLPSSGDYLVTVTNPSRGGKRGMGGLAAFDLTVGLSPRGFGPGPGRPPGAGQVPARPPSEVDWARVRMVPQAHGPLLQRMLRAPADVTGEAMMTTLYVLGPDLAGVVTEATTRYDRMENPSQVTVTATEGGIMDDDLLGVRHAVTLNRNSNRQWRITRYARGELRRRNLR